MNPALPDVYIKNMLLCLRDINIVKVIKRILNETGLRGKCQSSEILLGNKAHNQMMAEEEVGVGSGGYFSAQEIIAAYVVC